MNTTQEVLVNTYAIDPSHSRVGFTVRHLGFSRVRGSFGRFEGLIRLDPSDLTTLEAEGTIDATTISTSDEKRDAHLRSADFFEVEAYPTISFRSTSVKNVSGSSFTLGGEFTLHGVTRSIEIQGEFLGSARDPFGNEKIAIAADTKINRRDYGLNWNAALETGGVLVSDQVEITLDIQAALQQEGD